MRHPSPRVQLNSVGNDVVLRVRHAHATHRLSLGGEAADVLHVLDKHTTVGIWYWSKLAKRPGQGQERFQSQGSRALIIQQT